jgi:hypothetical protein
MWDCFLNGPTKPHITNIAHRNIIVPDQPQNKPIVGKYHWYSPKVIAVGWKYLVFCHDIS